MEINIVLESPALAVNSWFPEKNAPVKVEPES
jgi:hypothetical protein